MTDRSRYFNPSKNYWFSFNAFLISFKKNFYNANNVCGAILKLKAFCFGAIPDIMIELTACVGLPGLHPSGPK